MWSVFDTSHPIRTVRVHTNRVIFVPGAFPKLVEEVADVLSPFGMTVTNRHPELMRPGDFITVYIQEMRSFSQNPGLRGTATGAKFNANRYQPLCVYSRVWEWGTICHEVGHLIIGPPPRRFTNQLSPTHDTRLNNIIANNFGRVIERDQIDQGNGRLFQWTDGDRVPDLPPEDIGYVLYDIDGKKLR